MEQDGPIGDCHKISPTALLCAKVRAQWTKIPYAQKIVDELRGMESPLEEKIFNELTQEGMHRFLLPIVLLLEGRYAAVNDAISQVGGCSVLELASGLSPRSLEYAQKGICYVDTDLPPVIARKEGIIRRIRRKDPFPDDCLYTMPLDALNAEEMASAGERVRNKGPVAVVHEGLMMYLSDEERTALRDNVARFLRTYSPQGAWITTDFSSRPPEKENVLIGNVLHEIQGQTERPFNRFTSDEEVYAFLERAGLRGRILPNKQVLSRLTCLDVLGIDGKEGEKIADVSKAWFITVS